MPGKSYASETIEIHFDGKRCIHARKCVLTLPSVYQPGSKGGWIKPEGASAEEIAAMARTCPSGAITYTRRDGAPDEGSPPVNTVTVRENGPLEFRAQMQLDGEEIGPRAVLCRCGLSQNKPFCDGAHVKGKFQASGERAMREGDTLDAPDGPLTIDPTENGPLHVTGNMEICCGSGARMETKTDAWFCRCGQSQNKPFCDGSHKRVGWTSD